MDSAARRYALYLVGLLIACVGGPLCFGRSYIPPSPETFLAPSPDVQQVGYFSRDPTGSFAELSLAAFSTSAIRSGEMPFWNPYSGLGHPFLADPMMAGLFAPQNWLRLVLPRSAWDVIFVLNIVLASYVFFRWLLLAGMDAESAAVGALSWWALGSTQIYFNVPSVFNTVTALPLALLGVEALIRNPASRRGGAGAALGAFGIVVGGHATVTFISGIFLITYLLLRSLLLQDRKIAWRAGVWLAIGVCLAACQWVPFVEYLRFRGNTLDDFTNIRFRVLHLPALILPSIYGLLNSEGPAVPGGAPLGNYWSLGWLPPTMGPLLLAGLVGAVRFRRAPVAAACLGASLMAYAWSFGMPGLQHLSSLPFLSRIQGNYFPLVANVTVPLLVAGGYTWIREGGPWRGRIAILGWSALMVLALLAAALTTIPAPGSIPGVLYVFIHRSWPSWSCALLILISWTVLSRDTRPAVRFAFWSGVLVFGAVALYPWAGGSLRKEAFVSAVVALALALLIPRLFRWATVPFLYVGLAILLLFSVHAFLTSIGLGLPRRHPVVPTASYHDFLRGALSKTSSRAYGLHGHLFPNTGAAKRVETVNVLVSMLPLQVETFSRSLLDPTQVPVQLMGLAPRSAAGPDGAAAAVLRNRSMWNYIGGRFIVAPLDAFPERVQPAAAFAVSGGWSGDGGAVPKPLPTRAPGAAENTWPIRCGSHEWEGVAVELGTDGGAAATGQLTLELKRTSGEVVGRTQMSAEELSDASFARLVLGRPFCTPDEVLRLRIEHTRPGPGASVTVWQDAQSTKVLYYGLIAATPATSRSGGAGQFPLSKGVSAVIRCPEEAADELRVPLVTTTRPDGVVSLSLRTLDGNVRLSEEVPANVAATGMIHMPLPDGLCGTRSRQLRVELRYRPARAGRDDILYFARPEEPVVLDLITRPEGFALRFVDHDRKGAVLENLQAEEPVFLARASSTVANWQEALAAFQRAPRARDVAFVEEESACTAADGHDRERSQPQVRIQGRSLNWIDLRVETAEPRMLVWVASYAPGWSAFLDGRQTRVTRVNGVFTGVCILSAGVHRIEFWYFPPGFVEGLALTLAAVSAGVVLARQRTE